jgi:hypothetical protein
MLAGGVPRGNSHDGMKSEQQELVETLNDSGSVIFWKLDRKMAGATTRSKGFTILTSGKIWCQCRQYGAMARSQGD